MIYTQIFSARTAGAVYRAQLTELLAAPQVPAKGTTTRELINAITEISEPQHRIQFVPGRRMNPWLALSEGLWLLAGRNDVAALQPYSGGIVKFSDDGRTLYGAYGYRLAAQIPDLIRRLEIDPYDRRAVLVVWRPDDLTVDSNDPPCNDLIMFKVREGALHMTVCNRSNDLHWGLHAVNLPQFSMLQEYIASRLGVRMGTQTHLSQSLHIYETGPQAKITKRMMDARYEPYAHIDNAPIFPHISYDHKEFRDACSAVLDDHTEMPHPPGWTVPFLEFAHDFLRAYREYKQTGEYSLAGVRHANNYAEWIDVGWHFINSKR